MRSLLTGLLRKRRKQIVMNLEPVADVMGRAANGEGSYSAVMLRIADDVAAQALRMLLVNPNKEVREHRAMLRGFESRLSEGWGAGLDMFDLHRVLATEFGSDFHEKHRDEGLTRDDVVLETLARIHGRACMTAGEISVLIRSGYASGANARWRTLHELATVAFFIGDHDFEVARRYLEHQAISANKELRAFERFAPRLNEQPIEEAAALELKAERARLLALYGEAFDKPYGWAADCLEKESPNFQDIAEAVEFDHWTPYVHLAHEAVHAGSRGSYIDLGIPPDTEVMPSGPSHFGLAEPAVNAMLSLSQATTALLVHGIENYCAEATDAADGLVEGVLRFAQIRILGGLADRGADTFVALQNELEASPPIAKIPPRIFDSLYL